MGNACGCDGKYVEKPIGSKGPKKNFIEMLGSLTEDYVKTNYENQKNQLVEALYSLKASIGDCTCGNKEGLFKILEDVKFGVQDLITQNEALEVELKEYKREKILHTTKGVIKFMRKSVKEDLYWAMDNWRNPGLQLLESSFATEELDTSSLGDSIRIDSKSLHEAMEFITEENKSALQKNSLVNYYLNNKDKIKKHMPITNLMRVFEEMMDKKYERDCSDLASGRRTRSIREFAIEHLTRVYGIKKIAYQAVYSMLPTLDQLYQQRNHYGTIICRFLEVFHPEPFPENLALFLTKARVEFNRIAHTSKKELKFRKMPRGKSTGIHKNDKSNSNQVAFLADAMNLIYNMFPNDKYSRANALNSLKPESMSTEDFFLFRICHKIVRMGESTENIFAKMDVDKGGTIDKDELIEGIKKYLEISLPEEDVLCLFNTLDIKERGEISKETFMSKFNINNYFAKHKSDEYCISICHFLNALIESFRMMRIKDTAFLASWFYSQKVPHLELEEFKKFCQKQGTSLDEEELGEIYDCSLILNQDGNLNGLTCEAFCRAVIKNGIGGKGQRDFCNAYLGLKPESLLRKSETNIEFKTQEFKRSLTPKRSLRVSVSPLRSATSILSPAFKPQNSPTFGGLSDKFSLD